MNVGFRVRSLRQDAGLSLRALAEKSGLSASFISQMEREITQPSVVSLKQIADALGVRVHELLTDDDDGSGSRVVLRRADRPTWELAQTHYQLLVHPGKRLMQPQLVTYEPGAEMGAHPIVHEGEEFSMLLEGYSELRVGDEIFDMQPGDSAYFDASIPHNLRNKGEVPCVWLHVVTPSSF